MDQRDDAHPDQHEAPAGGWGSVRGIAAVARREGIGAGALATLASQNKPEGTMCTSCAFGRPAHPHPFEFCENGAKATLWDLTADRCTPEFFAAHTLTGLRVWSDHDLEMAGRLTHPLRYDPARDTYVECGWDEAFADIGARLKAMDPDGAVFYASGKAALETSYLWALLARLYGNNHLPDSSNMCHETTSVALKEAIGSAVGTCTFDDFDHCDAIFVCGQNPGTNSPRFLHQLQQAAKRGCRIVVFNPIREQGLVRFVNPQDPLQMLTQHATELAHLYLQVRPGGDIAVFAGLCKRVLEVDRQRRQAGQPRALDQAFIDAHCDGWETFEAFLDATGWDEIERHSGLSRADIEQAGDVYVDAERTIAVYGMGLTQHVQGAQSVRMFVNLMLMRGNIGRRGAGMSPMRGHSNVQGQRTVGIAEKPELVPLDKLAELFGFEPPRAHGMNTVAACEGVLSGRVKAFLALGGNFLRAVPDQSLLEPAWGSLELTVSIATKPNRSHLFPGKAGYLLPCLVRAERDEQAGGPQSVSIEDTFSHIHGSIGRREPASAQLRSEPAIVAGIAKATLPPNAHCDWDGWIGDYGRVRDLIEKTYPDQFRDFNRRMFDAGGFYKGNAARERTWKTASGKAGFLVPTQLTALGIGDAPGRMHLVTVRSNDQFNTTIYGHSDRLRGLSGSRMVALMCRQDIAAHGLSPGDTIALRTDAGDGVHRQVDGLVVTPFNLPRGCIAGYYPELNPLVPLWYHDEASGTPAAKGVPVRIVAAGQPRTTRSD